MRYLVAVDESEGSKYALTWALDNIVRTSVEPSDPAEQPEGIILLHVHEPVRYLMHPVGPVGVYPPIVLMESVRKAQEENSRRLLSQALEICTQRTVKAESMTLEGDVKEMICEAVDKLQPDVLIVGSRGLGMWKRAFLGSVSDYCAHHASCPVLIVKPPKSSKQQ